MGILAHEGCQLKKRLFQFIAWIRSNVWASYCFDSLKILIPIVFIPLAFLAQIYVKAFSTWHIVAIAGAFVFMEAMSVLSALEPRSLKASREGEIAELRSQKRRSRMAVFGMLYQVLWKMRNSSSLSIEEKRERLRPLQSALLEIIQSRLQDEEDIGKGQVIASWLTVQGRNPATKAFILERAMGPGHQGEMVYKLQIAPAPTGEGLARTIATGEPVWTFRNDRSFEANYGKNSPYESVLSVTISVANLDGAPPTVRDLIGIVEVHMLPGAMPGKPRGSPPNVQLADFIADLTWLIGFIERIIR
jgi:hypothetical protein